MGVIFLDIGATLVSGPSRGPAARLAERLRLKDPAGQELSAAIMRRDWRSATALATYLHDESGISDDVAKAVAKDVWEEQLHEARAIPGATDAVHHLLDAGIRVGLISNIWWPYFQSARECCGDLFERMASTAPIVLSCEEGIMKPCRAIFLKAAERAGVIPSRCVMVGDTYDTDVEGAAAAGMRTIWVLHRPHVETAALVRVLNRQAPEPNVAIAHVSNLTSALVKSVLESTCSPPGG